MFDRVDNTANLIAQEHRILEFWKETEMFDKLRAKNSEGPIWSFLDGPITANNPMGVHHAWGRTYKDCFQRFYAMKGYRLRYQNGFDCQGLWVEVEVEKELNFKSKRDIETYGLERFVNKCKERAAKYADIQTRQSIRLGYWMDWDNSYYTMTDENNYMIWSFLKKCHQRGYIYLGADSMPWCPRCGTGISQHEMHEGYKKTTDRSVYLKLPLRERPNEFLLVWTTTPWTLPANVACAVNENLEYSRIKMGNDILYVASALTSIFNRPDEAREIERLSGRQMVGWTYRGPFDELPAQAVARDHHRVVAWHDVSDTEGTGIVHIAPGCGKEDFELSKTEDLPILAPIDEDGVYYDRYGPLTGLNTADIADRIIQSLREKGYYVREEPYEHNYPHCWRCHHPLLFRHVHEWFIDMSWRREIMGCAEKIKWLPEWGLAREIDWLTNMHDWMISKKRYWGLALPIYKCTCGWFDVIGSREELKKRAVEGWDEFEGHTPHRPWIDHVKIRCEKCGRPVPRIKDVGNPWLDAGIVPYSTVGYATDRDYWQKWIPADLIIECFPGQFRNWFYALLAMSTMMENIPPFRTLFSYALVKDEKGEEMHKSAGNAIWFDDAAETMGVDVMRWTFCRHNPAVNLNFGYGMGKQVERSTFNTWWNVYAFFCNYARLDRFQPGSEMVPVAERSVMDRWILSNLHLLMETAEKSWREYNVTGLVRAAEGFIGRLSNWYIRRNRRRFWRGRSEDDTDKLAAYQTLYEVLTDLARLLAPLAPFVTETMYQNLVARRDSTAPPSVHLCSYPEAKRTLIDEELSGQMDTAVDLVSRALGLRKAGQIKVRQPLAELIVACREPKTTAFLRNFDNQVLDELNIKKLSFTDSLEPLATYSVKPDFGVMGPKYGQAVRTIAAALADCPSDKIAEAIKNDKPIVVLAGGKEYALTGDEIEIQKHYPEYLLIDDGSEPGVAIDTRLSPELVAEGYVRDFIRHIQIARKDKGFEFDQRIILEYVVKNERLSTAIDKWHDYIMAETLATRLSDGITGQPDKEILVGGESVVIRLEPSAQV